MFNCPSQATNGDAEDRQSSSPIEAVRAANEEVSKVWDDSYLEVSRRKIIYYLFAISITFIFTF